MLACPNCGGSVAIRAAGVTVSAICASCGATLDVANGELRMIADAVARTKQPAIPIGARGMLVGAQWEAIGYQERSNPAEGWRWEEYLLFNPFLGFRFLVHDEADWTLYAMLRRDVVVGEAGADAGDGRTYAPLSQGRARTDYVMGEFYWRVRVGDEVDMAEFAAPPHLLSREGNAQEVTWSRGVQLPAAPLRAAFGLTEAALPATALDKAATQRAGTRRVLWTALAAFAALWLLDGIPFGIDRNAPLFTQSFSVAAADKARPITTAPFSIPDARGDLQIEAASPVNNGWVELGVTLVDEAANRSFPSHILVEYYYGTDSDGAWNEGARQASALFANVPPGSYRMVVEYDAGAFANPHPAPLGFTLTVRRHVRSAAMFYLACVLLLAYPVWRWSADRGLPPRPKTK